MERSGEKIGWTGGWIGAFVWLVVFAIVWTFQGHATIAIIAFLLFVFSIILIVKLSPWKHPTTKYWKLMAPIFSMFLISVFFVVYVLNGFDDLSKIQYGLWIIPCFTPIFVLGNKKWQ